jgi:pilus assembly protein Flp/PilA
MIKIETVFSIASRHIRVFAADQDGTTAVEYALIASGIAVAIAAMVFSLGSSVKSLFVKVDTAL